MRILHVVPSYIPATRYGGPIYSVHGLAKSQAMAGNLVDVFTTSINGAENSPVTHNTRVLIDGVGVHYFKSGFGRRLFRSPDMFKVLKKRIHEYDILHIHSVFLWPTQMAARLARNSGVPYILAPRGMLVDELIRAKSRRTKELWISIFERENVNSAGAVHVTSKREASDLTKLGFRPKRVVIVPNGVSPPAPEEFVVDKNSVDKFVLFLGRISWKKGLDSIIRALKYADGINLVVAGNDDEGLLPSLLELALAEGVSDRVKYVGSVHGSEKWSLIAGAEAFVLASKNENFGIAVLEAMSMGVPPIVTPGVGLADLILQNEAGIVVDGDPVLIADTIKKVLGNSELRAELSDNAKTVAKKFSWNVISAEMKRSYDAVIAETRI